MPKLLLSATVLLCLPLSLLFLSPSFFSRMILIYCSSLSIKAISSGPPAPQA